MNDKVKCPLCGTMLTLEPHPSKPSRIVAVCNCRGVKTAVVEMQASKPTPIKKKESEL